MNRSRLSGTTEIREGARFRTLARAALNEVALNAEPAVADARRRTREA